MRQADVDDGIKDGLTTAEQDELVQLRRDKRRLEMENEILRRAAAYFAKDAAPKMMYPLVDDLADRRVPRAVTCGVLGFSTQGFYKWKAGRSVPGLGRRPPGQRHPGRARGRPRVRLPVHLRRARAGRARGARRTGSTGCAGSTTDLVDHHEEGPQGLGQDPGPAVHDDLVKRDFTAPAPDVMWLTDITEHWTGEGKLYAAAIKDVCSNRIVGYSTPIG